MARSLCQTVWRVLNQQNTEPPFDRAVPLPGLHPKDVETGVRTPPARACPRRQVREHVRRQVRERVAAGARTQPARAHTHARLRRQAGPAAAERVAARMPVSRWTGKPRYVRAMQHGSAITGVRFWLAPQCGRAPCSVEEADTVGAPRVQPTRRVGSRACCWRGWAGEGLTWARAPWWVTARSRARERWPAAA